MTPLVVLTEALSKGGRLLWDRPNKPRLMVPTALREQLESERDAVREVIRRATIFRQHALGFIQRGRALSILALPECPGGDGCLSCGAAIGPGHFRCEACTLAVQLALDATVDRPRGISAAEKDA